MHFVDMRESFPKTLSFNFLVLKHLNNKAKRFLTKNPTRHKNRKLWIRTSESIPGRKTLPNETSQDKSVFRG